MKSNQKVEICDQGESSLSTTNSEVPQTVKQPEAMMSTITNGVKPTPLKQQQPTKAASVPFIEPQTKEKFQPISSDTTHMLAQSRYLSFINLRCYDPGGFLVGLSSCLQNQTSPSNLQCLSEVKFKPFSSNHLIALPPKPPDVIHISSLNLPFSITTKGMTLMQFSDEYSFIVLQRVAEATKQAIKRKIVQATSVDFQSQSIPTKPKPSVISGSDIAKLFVLTPPSYQYFRWTKVIFPDENRHECFVLSV